MGRVGGWALPGAVDRCSVPCYESSLQVVLPFDGGCRDAPDAHDENNGLSGLFMDRLSLAVAASGIVA